MGGGKGGGTERQVYDFLLSVDYGVCYGPVKSVNRVMCKDKTVVASSFVASGVVAVNKPSLYGGDDGEGGPVGRIEFYLGDQDQLMSSSLASRFGLLPSEAPGYRGLCHVFFRGEGDDDEDEALSAEDFFGETVGGWIVEENWNVFIGTYQALMNILKPKQAAYGFRFTSNNPYLPPVEIEVTREPLGLTTSGLIYPITGIDEAGEYTIAEEGDAWSDGDFDPTKAPDANPAAMIYEVATNDEWGKGELPSAMDISSFETAATTLANEHFGLSLLWNKQDSFETFVGEVLDHIKGLYFQDARTGLWTLKLIRDDYDLNDALVLDDSNCRVASLQRTAWGETINEVVVEYTDPVSEETETVSSQNLANIAIQGGVISDTRDYSGVRNPWLAQQIADRDVIEASRTLTSATVHVSRSAFDKNPGDIAILTYPDEEVEEMVMRIMGVDYGKPSDRTIKLELKEDVFAARKTPTLSIQPAIPDEADIPDNPDQVLIMTPPLPPMLARGVDLAELDDDYPVSYVSFAISDEVMSMLDVQVYTDLTYANGAPYVGPLKRVPPTRASVLGTTLAPEARSELPAALLSMILRRDPEIGQTFVIGSSEENHEIIMLDSLDDATGVWTVLRGIWDTQPVAWAETDILRELNTTGATVDFTDRVAGTDTSYWLLPRTSNGSLGLDDADEQVFAPSTRLHLPFRPANVQVEGNGFDGAEYLGGAIPASIEVTWANRNRAGEDAVTLAWDDGNMAPEAGQETTIQFVDAVGAGGVEFEVTGLTGTSYGLDPDDLPSYRFYEVHVFSTRDGLESRETVVRTLELERVGYGSNYGHDYGENDGD